MSDERIARRIVRLRDYIANQQDSPQQELAWAALNDLEDALRKAEIERDAARVERDRVAEINRNLSHYKNALLVDGARLEREREEARAELSRVSVLLADANETIEATSASEEKAKLDAARYRWLRENFGELVFNTTEGGPSFCNGHSHELDASIDRALAEGAGRCKTCGAANPDRRYGAGACDCDVI